MLDEKLYEKKVKKSAMKVVDLLISEELSLSRTEQVCALTLAVYCYMKTMKERYQTKDASLENQCERLFKSIHEIEQTIGEGIVDLLGEEHE